MEITTAAELHRYLCDTKNYEFDQDGRDSGLYEGLKASLGLPPGQFLKALEDKATPAADYLAALLNAAEPLSKMYCDIWHMCKKSGILNSKNEKEILWTKFEGCRIEIDLEQFRKFEKIVNFTPPIFDDCLKTKTNLMNWVAHDLPLLYSNGGNSAADFFWSEIEPFRIIHNARSGFSAEQQNSLYGGIDSVINDKHEIARRIKKRKSVEDHSKYKEILEEVKSTFCPASIESRATDFINLPFWKFRWLIYELWITAVTVDELLNAGFVVLENSTKNCLELGSTITLAVHKDRNLKLTYQPSYLNSFGDDSRPDLVLSETEDHEIKPITWNRAKYIVECKQRIELTSKHISEVQARYEAAVEKNGKVAILNYDRNPTKDSVLNKTSLFVDVKPQSDGLTNFKNHIYSILIDAGFEQYAWYVDGSVSMENKLTDEFLEGISKTATSNPGIVHSFKFASNVEPLGFNKIKADIEMSAKDGDQNFEGDGVAKLIEHAYSLSNLKKAFFVTDLDDTYKNKIRDKLKGYCEVEFIEIQNT